jgi:thiosulfate/3-mercaptopyruvate sulfurtransferase
VTVDPDSVPLISVAELTGLMASPRPPAVLDVRWQLKGPPGLRTYLAGHVPGARYLDLDAELSGPPGAGGRHPLPAPAAFQSAMRRAGLRAGQLAVACDDSDATIAARLWWMMRYFGHDSVRVLDGGFRAWAAAGRNAGARRRRRRSASQVRLPA